MTTDLEELAAEAAAGDAEALTVLLVEVQHPVYRLSLRFLGDPTDAEDATQEILIRVVTRLSSFRGESRFSTWVYRVACNHLLRRREAGQRASELTFDQIEARLGQPPNSIRPEALQLAD